jgi:hypothetical protein
LAIFVLGCCYRIVPNEIDVGLMKINSPP